MIATADSGRQSPTTGADEIPGRIFRTLQYGGIVGLLLSGLIAAPARANYDLDRLLFDPVPLDRQAAALLPVPVARNGGDPVPASPTSAPASLSAVAGYRDAIDTLVGEDGPYGQELIEEYFALGRHFQALGQHEQAIEALDEAEYLSRVNEGLVSPRLFDIVEASISSHMALGDLRTANARQQYLYYLSREHYGSDSPQLVPILQEMGDWHLENFSRAIADPQPVISVSLSAPGQAPRGFDPARLAFGNLRQAQNMYFRAIRNMLDNHIVYAPELLELERKLVETIFMNANREGFLDDPAFFLGKFRRHTGTRLRRGEFAGQSGSFVNGRNAYERMLIYMNYQRQASAEDVARIMIERGDWFLIYQHNGRALQLYREALDYMNQMRLDRDVIDGVFSTPLPVQLPTFTALPHSRERFGIGEDTRLEYQGYIDLSFSLSRYGKARRIEVLERSESATGEVERRLRKLLASSPFRPRILTDEEETHRIRYYFTEVGSN